ncbi:hypothetical protein PROFUN_15626 [Planoprotostelium fungivorum]|uniref:Autophagy-related protein 16 domain-containing protein n=1 Tax=Planoprotostelium fungivorum TaxID=1890364 RepID=A0A2P6MVB9_9EUKA|nr:hypothetical protein PROFUN_15626 [Planoprotostelium fungivorum]
MSSTSLQQMQANLQHALAPTWKRDIFEQTQKMNLNTHPFQHVFNDYNKILSQNTSYAEKNDQLEQEVRRMNAENAGHMKFIKLYQEQSSSLLAIPEMEKKIQSLQEELTNSYKRNSENATMILDMNKEVKVMSDDIKHKEIELEDWKSRTNEAEAMIKKLEEQISEKDMVMEVLQEELKALQIELVKSEEKSKALAAENNTLINRWLEYKDREAQKMNEAMDNENVSLLDSMKAAIQRKVSLLKDDSTVALSSAPNILDSMAALNSVKVNPPSKVKRTVEAHKGDICAAAYNFSGTILATGGADHVLKLWDTRSQYSLRSPLQGGSQSIMDVKFSLNDEMVLAASNDSTVRLWAVQTGRLRHTLTGHEGKVLSASFTPDSQKVVSGSHDRTLKLWDLAKGYCMRTIFCFSSCNTLVLNAEGKMAISGHFDHHVRIWDVRSAECSHELDSLHSDQVTSVCLSPDSTTLLTNGRDNLLKLVDLRTNQEIGCFKDEGYKSAAIWNKASFSPDGQFVIAGGNDGKLFVWNTKTRKLQVALKSNISNPSPIFAAAWGHNMDSVTVDKGGMFTVWC